ncbi:type II toxin-antitoxin system HigB family toxin [Kosakonia oryzendophytica]|uniref:type II toxin-antitoxin system HigB family toxin n=1 Tax=Kosakonia oryzendophytica TaxID=1005665 RepID=UPI003D335155
MHLISMKAIQEAIHRFPQYRGELLTLAKTIEQANCPTPDELKKLYPTLDNFKYLSKYYVIDIANNNLRLVALIFFESQKFYVRHIFTHKEYDRFTEQHRTKGKKK